MSDNQKSPEGKELDPWLRVVAGHFSALETPDFRLAAAVGWLIRSRFRSALNDVRSEHEPTLTRARLLALARQTRAGLRWRRKVAAVALAFAVGGACTFATVIYHKRASLGVVSSELESAAGTQATASEAGIDVYIIRVRDVGRTARELVEVLVTARVKFRVRTLGRRGFQVEVDAMTTAPAVLTRLATELHIQWNFDRPLRLLIEPA